MPTTVTLHAWMSALAAAAGLALAAVAVIRAAKNPLSVPLALLAANQVMWNTASVFLLGGGDPSWRWLGAIVAPLFPPAALWFVLQFVGRARELKTLHLVVWLVYGAQSLAGLYLLVTPAADSDSIFGWISVAHMACDLPLLSFGVYLIVGHARRTSDPRELTRSRLLLFALVVFVVFVSTDMLADMGVAVDRWAAVGSFVFNSLLFTLTFRLGVYSEIDRAAGAITTVIAVLLVLVGYLAVVSATQGSTTLTIVCLVAVTLTLFGVGRYALIAWSQERAGLERLAVMGRFSAQMAHDLKNPLAAARGAAQFLEEEVRQGRGIAEQAEFLKLLSDQLERLGRLIDRYQKLGKLELSPSPLDANALVEQVLALQSFAGNSGVKVVKALAPGPLPLTADSELLSSALENLVKNAFEASPNGGQITVTSRTGKGAAVEFEVEDTGTGMSARALERAFDLFFTTKAQGSGMGLHFVRQVARAHGGDALLWSQEGRGTRVTLRLPREPTTQSRAPSPAPPGPLPAG